MKPASLTIATVVLLSVTWTTVCGDACSDLRIGGFQEKTFSVFDNCDDLCGGFYVSDKNLTCVGSVRVKQMRCGGKTGIGRAIRYCCCWIP